MERKQAAKMKEPVCGCGSRLDLTDKQSPKCFNCGTLAINCKCLTKLNPIQQPAFDRLISTWRERLGAEKITPEFVKEWKERFLLFDRRGDAKKVVKAAFGDGKTYLVPIVDIMLEGLKGKELGHKYKEELPDDDKHWEVF